MMERDPERIEEALHRFARRAAERCAGLSGEQAEREALEEEVAAALKELGFDRESLLDGAVTDALATLDRLDREQNGA